MAGNKKVAVPLVYIAQVMKTLGKKSQLVYVKVIKQTSKCTFAKMLNSCMNTHTHKYTHIYTKRKAGV